MRGSLLLVLVPIVAWADASTPGTAAPQPRPAAIFTDVGGRTVTVGFGADWKIHVRVEGGGELVLEPAGQAYVGREAWRVEAERIYDVVAAPLLKVSSRPEACGDFWEIYVSVVDGVPRKALELDGMADPPAMSTPSVKFDGNGGAVVTTRTSEDEDGKKVRLARRRYRFDGRVFVEVVSKRATTRSK